MTPRERAPLTRAARAWIVAAFAVLAAGMGAWMWTSEWRMAASGAMAFLLCLVSAAMSTGNRP